MRYLISLRANTFKEIKSTTVVCYMPRNKKIYLDIIRETPVQIPHIGLQELHPHQKGHAHVRGYIVSHSLFGISCKETWEPAYKQILNTSSVRSQNLHVFSPQIRHWQSHYSLEI